MEKWNPQKVIMRPVTILKCPKCDNSFSFKSLDGKDFQPEIIRTTKFSIFVTEPIWFKSKPYRLVWTTHPDKNYIGVINAFRRRYEKK